MKELPDCRNDSLYNQKYLSSIDKKFLKGYDYCMDTLSEFMDGLSSNMVAAKIADMLKEVAENKRNEFIVSMIDQMDDDEYEARRGFQEGA